MPIETLQKLGLSVNEAKIYEALLSLKEAGVGDISSKTEIHRRSVYDALKRLINKGLVFPVLSKGENLYSPAQPDKLAQLIEQKQEILEEILPDLQKKYIKRQANQGAYIYRGHEGVKNYMRDIIREKQDTYTIGVKLGWLDPRLRIFAEQVIKKQKAKGANFYFIIDEGIPEKAPEDVKKFNPDYRILPKKYATNSAVDIFGDYVVTFAGMHYKEIPDDVTIFVLKDKRLAESFRTWFQFMYDYCPKPKSQKRKSRK